MAIQYYRGAFYAQLQSESSHFDPQRGYVYRATFKSLSAEQCEGIQNDYIQQGCECELETILGVTTLHVVDSTQEFTLDDWQLDGENFTIDLFSHPTLLNLANLTSGSDPGESFFGLLRDSLDNHIEPFGNGSVYTTFISLGWSVDEATTIAKFYTLYLRGSDQYENDMDGSGYVLKHTTNVSNRWQTNIADNNVGQIYSTAELLSEVQDSSLWTNPIPPRLAFKIANFPPPVPQPDYFWGWRKSRSNEGTAANNRVGIGTNYTLALWSSVEYIPFQ